MTGPSRIVIASNIAEQSRTMTDIGLAIICSVPTHHAYEFAESLRALHIKCGKPSYTRICELAAETGGHPLSPSTISEVLNGKRLPKVEFVLSFVRALATYRDDGPLAAKHEAETRRWRQNWQQAQLKQARALAGEGRCVCCGRAYG
ncbi:helix-turn-helix transcriptional regulator [Kibdelosporangium philippinense]|uniref:Helix-turn-helix transcriptional regulator n=1 Tax=Kibdelosporangium philippinense TaxID=211113 RepID=A0ABS8ZGJ6_9PSEU|nr:helix-turn-helix transcriptional regulator [Kibdelosporangium philippinense]MCE7006662.1 helix-turn-helix transcriptional regulator [Kibdelosporangium philippinense]